MHRATIKDIASEVGVSHTTVSYVLNGNTNQKISEKTKEAVLTAAKKLNYVPNEAARSLRRDSTECIAVALEKSITHSRFSGILQGIREELNKEGYGLLLMDFHTQKNKKNPAYLESVLQQRTDGIIYISSDGQPPVCSKRIEKHKVPFVSCDCCPIEESLHSVSFDYEKGAFDVACRLFGEGAKKIMYWQPDVDTFQEQYRINGLKKACELYPGTSLEICKMPLTNSDSSFEYNDNTINDTCRQSLAQNLLPKLTKYEDKDAVICGWGIMVSHLCSALYHNNSKQLKIALLSDAEIPMIPDLKILASRPGFIRGGKECVKLLLSQIRNEETTKRIVLAPEPPTYISY